MPTNANLTQKVATERADDFLKRNGPHFGWMVCSQWLSCLTVHWSDKLEANDFTVEAGHAIHQVFLGHQRLM